MSTIPINYSQPYLHFYGAPSCAFGGSGKFIQEYTKYVYGFHLYGTSPNESSLKNPYVLVVKHPDDDRKNGSEIRSSSRPKTLEAIVTDDVDKIASLVTPKTHVVMINSVQLYEDPSIVTLCDELVQSGRRVFVTAVKLRGDEPYNHAGKICAHADMNEWRRPPCYVGAHCGKLASRSRYFSHTDRLRPVCYSHHNFGASGTGLFRMFIGSMFAAKSEAMAQFSTEVIVPQGNFKYKGEDRRGENITTFNGTTIDVTRLELPEDLEREVMERMLQVVNIDEPFMFSFENGKNPKYKKGISEVIKNLVLKGTVVNVASILMSFQNTPLPDVPEMLSCADEVHMSYSYCTNPFAHGSCRHPATRNQLMYKNSDGVLIPEMYKKDQNVIVVGDSIEKVADKKEERTPVYFPTCRDHYTLVGYPEPEFSFPPVDSIFPPESNLKTSPMYLHDSPKRNV